ncbi:putative rabenosyn Rab binding domain [Lyophyllum shimeji]|uniref:Rabenosyn Rab binding domain n=1 Tax=Lyophyllum shimeji TaxID=47721 RepID=A0A9P3PFI7_LYOSH|nr:putative rabenosyn Rab binding domain [Lyophyllum shimeji]
MPDAVPYQAYRSKRQPHNLSSPPSGSRPTSIIVSTPSPSPQFQDKEKEVLSAYTFPNSRSSPPVIQVLNPAPVAQELPSPKESIDSFEHDSSPPASPRTNGTNYEPKFVSTTSTASSSSSAGPSLSPQLKDSKPLSTPAKKASTFRRVPPRNSRTPLPSSPLGLNHSSPGHSRHVSTSSLNQSLLPPHDSVARSPPQRDTLSRPISSPSNTTASGDRQLPQVPSLGTPSNAQETVCTPDSVSSPSPSTHLTRSVSSAPSASASMLGSNCSTPPQKPSAQRTQAPYRPGFQPKGLYRPLTDDFIALRRVKRDGQGENGQGSGMKRVERTKLTRRLEKLIDLHFPPPVGDCMSSSASGDRRGSRTGGGSSVDNSVVNRRASAFFDFDIRNMKFSDAGDLWRGVIGVAEVHNIRAAEQRITPWQYDADVVKCPLCTTSFHPLTNRKHHCRLCGQIICSLPVKRPHRPVPCSILFVVDPNTGRIEEVGEGVDYGVRRKVNAGGTCDAGAGSNAEEDKFLKGVRICRTCRPILLRQQYKQEMTHVPTLAKLYEAFTALEQEIEEALPHFQELVLSLSHNDQPTKEASAARKRLLEAFGQYDALARRIRKLPCPNGPGSSQDRVQVAIMTRASIFLQKNMFPLQSLPTPKTSTPANSPPGDPGPHQLDPGSKMALALQPLLEQEALLETFVEEAKAQRKFEDVKTLKTNLREIRAEIERIVANADTGMQGSTSGQ